MPLTPGSKLGQYKVVASIGAGGMGEVYRARDTKLGRDVAIKVLPEAFARDGARLDRFEREARLLAQLNHANIATLHGLDEHDGQQFLVMELVEGETLAERIAQGPLPVDEAIPLFIQIAEGLEAAHGKGIIHRDLKPANLKIAPDGNVKLLDFGLAKPMAGAAVRDLSQSPTLARTATETGALLGTVPYMSPEQVRGQPVDDRTDIWAYGCCLFEALSGRPPFLGETVSDTIAVILNGDPDWRALPSSAPVAARRLLRRCLRKDRASRLHHIADARLEMEDALEPPSDESLAGDNPAINFTKGAAALLLLALVVFGAAYFGGSGESPRSDEVVRSIVPLTGGELFRSFQYSPSVAISPDGRHVAYVAAHGGSTRLYLRPLSGLEWTEVADSEGATMPFFSHDSRSLAFRRDRRFVKVSVDGGAPVVVSPTDVGVTSASWGVGGIVFPGDSATGLSRLETEDGAVEALSTVNREGLEKTHRLPDVLPGGAEVLFTLFHGDRDSYDEASIALLDVATGEYEVLLEGGTSARYSPSGHLVYARGGTLFAVPFDLGARRLLGQPVTVVEGVTMSRRNGGVEFSLSREGTLVYARGDVWGESRRLVSVDREGRVKPLAEMRRAFEQPTVSPDGRWIEVSIGAGNDSVWLFDVNRGTLSRVTGIFDNIWSVWSPDSRELIFTSSRGGDFNLFRQVADGSEPARQITQSENTQVPTSWSPDGQTIAFTDSHPSTNSDIWTLTLGGAARPEPFLRTEFSETAAHFSPNGRWVAYQSDESGQTEIYIRPFPLSSGKWLVSNGGGTSPRWNPKGGELFYREEDRMMAVDVRTEGELALGRPRVLFRKDSPFLGDYDVTPDGQGFVMVEESDSEGAPSELVLVQNFHEELQRLVPAN